MPYQPTWNNSYLPVNGPSSAIGQSVIPAQQMQLATGWQQPVNGIVKVNGRDSALQVQLPPNSTSQPMFDNNGKVFYVVSTDGTGGKTIEEFDFSPHPSAPVSVNGAEFVSREEFEAFVGKVSAALEVINEPDGPVRAGRHSDGSPASDKEPGGR